MDICTLEANQLSIAARQQMQISRGFDEINKRLEEFRITSSSVNNPQTNFGSDFPQDSEDNGVNRDIKRAQLTQVIGGRIRDGETLLTLAQACEMKVNGPAWNTRSITKGLSHTICNEISLCGSFDV